MERPAISRPKALTPGILFEDNHLIVLSKPSGLLSQGEKTGDANVVDWLRERWGRPYVGLIHRLDRNTSGLMVVAKRTKAAQRLTDALQSDRLARRYLAWLHGTPPEHFRWNHQLVKDEATNKVRAIRVETQEGAKSSRHATLTGRSLRRCRWKHQAVTLVELTLETGRSHQIRVQSSESGHPVLGDRKYGSDDRFPRLALHSYRLSFPHPMQKGQPDELMEFEDPLPPELSPDRQDGLFTECVAVSNP